MARRLGQPFVLLAMIALGACETPTPPTPSPDAPTLTCPASASLVSPDGAPVPHAFTVPTAVNGQLPVIVSCSKATGSTFPLGSTIVTCTATDALARQTSCNFNVTVTAIPKISKTRLLGFGDSITFGRCGPKNPLPNTCPPYTVRLEELLRGRYTQQSFQVFTRGQPGETAVQGEDWLPIELNNYNPEVLMLMEGTNDLTDGSALPKALDSLEAMIDLARSRGVMVFLATVPPIAPGGTYNSQVPLVAPFNAEIRNIAARKGVPLVDVYSALNVDIPRYYVGDDLHPTGEALRVIGETFYAKIRETLDITPTGTSTVMLYRLAGLLDSPGRLSPGLKTRPPRTPLQICPATIQSGYSSFSFDNGC